LPVLRIQFVAMMIQASNANVIQFFFSNYNLNIHYYLLHLRFVDRLVIYFC